MSDHTYVLRAPCGCIRGAVVDDGSATVPQFVAEGIRRGYAAIWLDTSAVRAMRWKCETSACPFDPQHGPSLLDEATR